MIVAGLVAAVLLIAAAAWLASRVWLAKGELEAAAAAGEDLQGSLASLDATAASEDAARLAEHSAAARSLVEDPVWRASEWVPWAGDDLAAVRTLAVALDDVATEAIGPIVGVLGAFDLDALRGEDGRIDLGPLQEAAPIVHSASSAIDAALADVRALPADDLLGPVEEAHARFDGVLAEASELAGGADGTLSVLPAMLGADGPRNYLLLSLNNAELRSTGGIPGALTLLRVEDGLVGIARHATTADFPALPEPLPLDEGTRAVYGESVGRYIQNVTMTPDFAETGRLAAQMWETRLGDRIDGVFGLDPVALSYLMRATGPVAVDGGEPIDASNAVQRLLVDPYRDVDFDNDQRDLWFGAVAAAAFTSALTGPIDLAVVVDAVTQAAEEQRIAAWSAVPEEQDLVASSPFGGLLAAQDRSGGEAYGVFLNDATGSKMDAYLDVAIAVGAVEERPDGRADVTVKVTLSNSVTEADLALLPEDVRGAYWGPGDGRVETIATVYAPPGAFEGGVTVDGTKVEYRTSTDRGRLATGLQVDVLPGETRVVEFRYVSAEPGQADPVVVHTPLIHPLEVGGL